MQVSTVGPNLNLKFLHLINKGGSAYGNSDLILIGPCDLHIVHRAFQHDSKDSSWSVGKVLQARLKILDQSPSRRADYDRITSPTENVFERTESILDNFVSLINYWKTWLISKQPDKNNKSYLTVQEAVTDPSIKTKFSFFFEIVATHLNSFLKGLLNLSSYYFVFNHQYCLHLLQLLNIRKSVLEDAVITDTLAMIDPQLNINHKQNEDVDIGFGAEAVISDFRKKGGAGSTRVLTFKNNSGRFLATLHSAWLRKPYEIHICQKFYMH